MKKLLVTALAMGAIGSAHLARLFDRFYRVDASLP
jgi:hypothetical protein